MAYVIGFMFADGSLVDSDKSSRTYYISFCNNDYYVLNSIREAMKSEHRIYKKPSQLMTHRNKQYRAKPGYYFRIGNKNMYQDLLKLGMKHRKSNDMVLPSVPDKCFLHFLRGYFDGDGCINLYTKSNQTNPSLSLIFTSGSISFLKAISSKLAKILSIDLIHIYQSMGAYNLQTKGYKAFRILEYIYSDLDTVPYMRRKYNKFINYRNNLIGPRIRKRLG